MTVVLTGHDLTLDDVVQVARRGERVELAPAAVSRMQERRGLVERAIARGDAVYGTTTGVGVRKRVRVDATVEFIEPMGNDTMVTFRVAETEIVARCSPEAALGRGATMSFSIDMDRMHLIDPDTQYVIQPGAPYGHV